jgi:predicted naringenin-chalcone synthase
VLRDPHARLAVVLVASLALWAPFGLAALRGELEVVPAVLRYLVAFVGCSVAVHGIAHLVASYHALQAEPAVVTEAEPGGDAGLDGPPTTDAPAPS